MTMKLSGLTLSFAIALACALPVANADGAPRTVVRAGHLLDVDSGKMLSDQAVAHRGWPHRCPSQPGARPAAGNGAKVSNWSAYTVVPGLMDMHTHLADERTVRRLRRAPLQSNAGARCLHRREECARHPARRLHHRARCRRLPRLRRCRAARRDQRRPDVPGPRMFVAGAYITITGGGGEITGLPPGTVVPPSSAVGVSKCGKRSAQAGRLPAGRRRRLHQGDRHRRRAGRQAPSPASPNTPKRKSAPPWRKPRKRGNFVAAHAHGAEGIKRAVRAGVRSIEHGSLIDDEAIALMKQHGTWLVADIYNGDYIDTVGRREGWSEEIMRKNLETTDAQREGFRKAVKAGVASRYGTDAGVYPHGDNARQFAYMVKLRHDAAAGDPLGDDRFGAPAGQGEGTRLDCGRQGRRPGRGGVRSAAGRRMPAQGARRGQRR